MGGGGTSPGGPRSLAKTLTSTINRRKGLPFSATSSTTATVRGPRRSSTRPLVPRSQGPSREGSPVSAVSSNAPYYAYSATGGGPGSTTEKRCMLSSSLQI